jgi:dCMP deaminase
MVRPAFDDIFIELAVKLAKRSHCVKLQVGAVLAKDTRIISIGYNGPPAGTHNCDEEWPEVGCPRSLNGGCSLALHAEQNAILYALQNQAAVAGATLYITLAPCLPCARVIFTVGIKKVIYVDSYAVYKGLEKEEGIEFLESFGIVVECYKKPVHENFKLNF